MGRIENIRRQVAEFRLAEGRRPGEPPAMMRRPPPQRMSDETLRLLVRRAGPGEAERIAAMRERVRRNILEMGIQRRLQTQNLAPGSWEWLVRRAVTASRTREQLKRMGYGNRRV
ncbi:MAG: hypothetical protein V1787_01700 [Candidatus Micrarchaeota archaeon]